ncbi:glycosyltransferase family 4 protein [Rhodospirillaceae bacterium KN72]|uniref:Glycosyltransferase family 4 protein n=1 Tax=Pacificispira spongiicola TaxID=2729598 RepID=A0A7Y0E1S1_9PROT|nr:glycosyltransferase family 4 protein [Pacificispira spongiicola]NMM44866.1 glycosyltransferase family 4 protein [Pacificispira spongiicola]
MSATEDQSTGGGPEGLGTVLQVLPALETGGVERTAVDIAIALKDAGYHPLVASSGGRMVRELARADIEHIDLPLASKNWLTMRRNADRLEAIIRDRNVDIVHARSRAPAWSAYWAAQRTGTRFVTTFHGTYNFTNPLKKFYNSVMVRADRVIANSEFIRRHIQANYRVDGTKLRVIHRGIDIDLYSGEAVSAERLIRLSERWRLPDGVPVVMLPGRLTRWKGQLLLVKALAEMQTRPVRCLLVGDAQGRTAFEQEVLALARKLKVDHAVHVVGACDDMPAALKLSDVVVSASTDPEAFGRVAVEGQAMGRLVVAPAHGGAPEQIMDRETGFLFRPGDAYDLANKLDIALNLSPEQRQRIGAAAVANAQAHFTKTGMAKATLDVYEELLRAPARAPAASAA